MTIVNKGASSVKQKMPIVKRGMKKLMLTVKRQMLDKNGAGGGRNTLVSGSVGQISC